MAAVFISHSSADRAAAEAVAAALRRRGCHSLFLDSDPEGGIGVGRRWEDTLYQELGACQAVVVLCSPAARESRWVFAEITHARSLGKPLLPARIAPGEPPSILADTQLLDLSARDEAGYERLWEALQRTGIGHGVALAPERPPYPGLAGFQAGDAAVFFGRDTLVRSVVEELERLRREGGAQLLLLAGPAGAGKASLLRAGVVPALGRQGDWLVVGPFRPRGDAMAPLRTAVAGTGPDVDVGSAAAFAGALRRACDRPRATVVLAIESLESLLAPVEQTALSARHDQGLTAWLHAVLGSGDESLLCVATLRADQRGDLEDSELGGVPAVEIEVPLPDRRSLPEIISRPALAAGGEVSAELVVALVEELRGGAGLVDLAAALHRLWEEGDGRELTLARYRSLIGDLAGHIDRSAERALDLEHHGEDEVRALRRALRSLVRVGAEGHLLPTVVDIARLQEPARPLMERLTAAGLVVRVEEATDTGPALALAHAAVAERWRRLRRWLDEDLEFLRWRRRFAAPVAAWQARGERLGRRELAEAERWAHVHPAELSDDALRLIRRSRAALRRRTLALVSTTALVIVALAGLSVFALYQRDAAEKRLAAAHRIAAVDQRDRVGDLLLAAHHFARVARLSREPSVADSARLALGFLAGGVRLDGIGELGEEALGAGQTDGGEILVWGTRHVLVGSTGIRRLGLPPGEIPRALMGGDGEHLLSQHGTRELRVTNLRGEAASRAVDLPDALLSARPDRVGRTVLAWTRNGRLLRWDPAESSPAVLEHGGTIWGMLEVDEAGALLSFGSNPAARYWPGDGSEPRTLDLPHDVYAAAATSAGRVVLITGSKTLITWEPPEGPVREIALQRPMDQVRPLAEGGFLLWDGDGVIWRLAPEAEALETLHRHGDALTCVERSPDGRLLATCGLEREVRIWDFGADDGALPVPTVPCKACSARFSPDGQTLLTWSDDGQLQRWDVETGQALGLPMRHAGPIGGAFFAEDGRSLWSWSRDGQMRRWTLPAVAVPTLTVGTGSAALAVAAGGSDRAVVYANRLGEVCRWSGEAGRFATCQALEGLPESRLNDAMLSPDGASLVGRWQGGTGMWRTLRGSLLVKRGARPGDPQSPELNARFSADGRRLLLWGESGQSRLWDVDPPLELPDLVHPGIADHGDLGTDGRHSLLLGRELVRVWDTPVGEQPLQWRQPRVLSQSGPGGALLTSDNHHVMTWGEPGRLERWSLETATRLGPVELPALGDIAGAVTAAGTGRILLWGGATAVSLEDSEMGPAMNHGAAIRGAILGGDGILVATWDDFDARLWEPRSGTPVTPALRHGERIRGAILAEDAGWVLLWSPGSLRRWPLTPERAEGNPVEWLEQVSGTRLAEGAGSTSWQLELIPRGVWAAMRAGN